MNSPFLAIAEADWVASNDLAFAVRDRFPVSQGHTLIITRRLVPTWFDASEAERRALFALVEDVKRQLDAEYRPDGYNVGFNAGEAAGQTVMHVHVHVIPRYRGDVEDPRGGVRHVIPGKGNYLRGAVRSLATGAANDPFLAHISPLFERANDVAIVAAFVQDSGLELLRTHISAALERGARVRLVTGDYLNITQAAALERLLDWQNAAGAHDLELVEAPGPTGIFEGRIIEVARLPQPVRSFHPKSWRFEGPGFATAFVGSSNVSHSALATGIEWNLRLDRATDPAAYASIVSAFDALWPRALPLEAGWVREYAARARLFSITLPPGEAEAEPLAPPPHPHPIQSEALAALVEARANGRTRALVVLATGLGKTWLAAFDAGVMRRSLGGECRILFLAHRKELLTQAADTFRRMLRQEHPTAQFGWFVGDHDELEGDVVLASVQKLARPENLARLRPDDFGYVVVDEVHHAAAPTYARILEHLRPRFLLGLTATPERADEGDVAGVFDDFVAFRADLGVGIAHDLLVPFAYFGLKDTVDYANMPWRNRRFDPDALAAAVQTQARMARMWAAWREHPGSRTLVFCCSIEHARFVSGWLREQGARSVAVYAGEGSADRAAALNALAAGELDAICAVDLFNEGIDVPLVDRVVMLRPTESPVLFLQQLGRGLRRAPAKAALTVIDFVGNHRVFLQRLRTLLSFGSEPSTLYSFLVQNDPPELPPGCSIDVELEAIDLLRRLVPSGRSEVERAYREVREARGERPSAGELYRMGYRPGTLAPAHESWFDFVASEGDFSPAQLAVVAAARAWFRELEKTPLTKCFKMVLVEALIDGDALVAGMALDELAVRCHAILRRSPELFRDLLDVKELPDPATPPTRTWLRYWNGNPVSAWARQPWFSVVGERLVPRLPIPEGPGTELFVALSRELVDYQLARYRMRGRQDASGDSFECRITWNQRDPILSLPSRKLRPDLPEDWVPVRLPDGTVWDFKFAKVFCNVARPAGADRNTLPDLLRRWFGPGVGHPGTAFQVRFARSPDGWWIEPVGGSVIPLRRPKMLIAYPTLRAAAGAATGALEDAPNAEEVRLPAAERDKDQFAVRAAGDSMDGGRKPIRDGDWLVMRLARGAGIGALADRVALVQVPDEGAGYLHQIKRIVNNTGGWSLQSDNPSRPSFPTTSETIPVAVLVDIVRPEDLAPAVGDRLDEPSFTKAFKIDGPPRTGRIDGHLFLCVEQDGLFVAPDRLRFPVHDRRPGETAFVLARTPASDTPWRYCGVARWLVEETLWSLPDLDYSTWRAMGQGRGCSRRLPVGALDRARAATTALLERCPPCSWAALGDKRCRIVGEAAEGGLRIDGGDGGFATRTVSVNDLAWGLVAAADVRENGGLLDEARVNRLRYLDGTPRQSTRWIDTGWALLVVKRLDPSFT